MLISWVITLQPTEPATVSPNLGRAVHAWFMDQVQQADPALADTLHGEPAQRPFTVSNLLGIGWRQQGQVTLSLDKSYALRVTSFAPQLSATLRERVLPNLPATITLSGVPLSVTGNTIDPQVHPWAGADSFEELVQRHTLGTRLPRRVSLRFASPTLFRSSNMNVPIPLPGLVFGGLLEKWNAFAPLQLHPDVRSFAQECLAVSRYRLETRQVAFGADGRRGVVAGCVGDCTYAIQNLDRYWMGLIHLLAAFALYAGVGRRTTMGLGQVRMLGARGWGLALRQACILRLVY